MKMARNFHNKSESASPENIRHSIELDEDYKMHVLGWKVQRIGWILLYLFLVLAGIGLFGNGLLSKRSIDVNPFKLEYEHYGRYESTMKIFVHFPAQKLTTISIPIQYLHEMKIEHIVPEPESKKLVSGNYILTFPEVNNGELIITLLPQTTGTVNSTILINDRSFAISHCIYP